MTTVEFWFDFSCPYAYLASGAIEAVCAAGGARLELAPMLLGGVFRSTGAGAGPMATLAPIKAVHNARDMARWAERRGMRLAMPAAHPMRTVRALRTMLALPHDTWATAMHALYAAYWVDGRDVTDDAVLRAALTGAGIAASTVDAALGAADSDAIKAELRTRTDRAVALGAFGAPAIVVHRDDAAPLLLWGQDRLHWLAAVLDGWDPDVGPPPRRPSADPGEVGLPLSPAPAIDFWFDFSSPFAYLGATQIEQLAADAGAAVTFRPMLLGALFRDLGTADVPLLHMPEAKRRYVARELEQWARWWDVPFRFTSRFPLRTVAPLRLVLLAGDRAPALIARVFRAAWAEERDIGDLDVLRGLAKDVDLDPALVDRTAEPAVKQALVDATAAARAAGVFGAPTTIVHSAGGPLAFWGQDRFDLVAATLRGWRPEAG